MNFQSVEWQAVEELLRKRLAELDQSNRDPSLDFNSTLGLRGEIQSLLWVLAWPRRQEAENTTEPEVHFGV
jgi:hypothetical protein